MADVTNLVVGQIPALRRYARALVGDPAGADDLVQDCLERALSRLRLFQTKKDIRVWLFTILHNLYVSTMRRESRQPTLMPLTDEVGRLSVGAAQDAGLEIADLGRALDQLPAEQKAAVLLVGLEDMTYADAAAALGIPPGTLMSRLHRGRKRLAATLAGDAPARLKRVK